MLVTEELKRGISAAFSIIPASFLIISILLMIFGYGLSREKVTQYQKEIDERKKQES
jgi:GPH family glycoside/pentoside/hexuronide:cation symporter